MVRRRRAPEDQERLASPTSTAPPGSAGRRRSPSHVRSSPGPPRRSSPPTCPCPARPRTCSATGWPGSSTRPTPCWTRRARRGSSASSCARSPPTSGGGSEDYSEARDRRRRPVRPATPGGPAECDRPGDGAPLAADRHPGGRAADLDRVRRTGCRRAGPGRPGRVGRAAGGGAGRPAARLPRRGAGPPGRTGQPGPDRRRQGPAQRHRGGAARRADRALLRPDRSALPAFRARLRACSRCSPGSTGTTCPRAWSG